jgi:hypothetical protein
VLIGELVGVAPYFFLTLCVNARSIATVTGGRDSLSAMDTALVLGDGVVDFGMACDVSKPLAMGRAGVVGVARETLGISTRGRFAMLVELSAAISVKLRQRVVCVHT